MLARSALAPRKTDLGFYGRTAFIFVVESAGKTLLFITTFVAASVLPSSEFAIFGVIIAMQQFVAIIIQGGLGEAVLAEIAKGKIEDGKNFIYRAAFCGLVTTSTIALIVLVVWWCTLSPLRDGRGLALILALLGNGVATSFLLLRASFMVIEGETQRSCVVRALVYFFGSGGGIIMLMIERSANAYFVGQVLFVLPTVYLVSVWSGNLCTTASADWRRTRRLLGRSVSFTFTSLFGWASSSGATLVIYYHFDARTTACYTLMTALCGVLIFITSSVNQGWQPEMLKSIRGEGLNQKAGHERLGGLMELALLGGASGLLVVIAFSRDLSFWFASSYPELEFIVSIGFVSVLANLNYFVAVNQFVYRGKGGLLLQVSIGCNILGGLLWVALGYVYGETGVYLGWGLVMLLRGVTVSAIAAHRWGIKSNVWRTTRILVMFVFVVYFISYSKHVQALRSLISAHMESFL